MKQLHETKILYLNTHFVTVTDIFSLFNQVNCFQSKLYCVLDGLAAMVWGLDVLLDTLSTLSVHVKNNNLNKTLTCAALFFTCQGFCPVFFSGQDHCI